MKPLYLLLALSLTAGCLNARTNIDENWKFILKDLSGAESIQFNDENWQRLDVPHDWSVEEGYHEDNPMGARGGYLSGGIAWYRKEISVSKEWKEKHVEIAFDGVFMNSKVWVNGQLLGERPYGWISFSYDISKIVKTSDTLTVAVRVDNEKQPSARWYSGSGIYGHTWIDVKEPVHVKNDGVYIRTKGNSIEIDTEITNTTTSDTPVFLKTIIKDHTGKIVTSSESKIVAAPGESKSVTQQLTIDDFQRWTMDSPYLYTAVSELTVRGENYESKTTRFGMRDIEWIPETGMWINGENIKLRGVCNHQDAGAFGAGVPDKILRYRIEQLKKMGCNTIRTSHNPQTPIFYDICDELGMLVMDELFDGWSKKAAHDYGRYHFDDWWKRDVTDWMKRDRNHPSIVIYSVGNETHGEIAEELVAFCHSLDSTRPVTSGSSESQHMDVFGANGGSESKGFFERYAANPKSKEKVFIGTENPHTWQVRGYYRTQSWFRDGYPNPKRGPHEIPNLTEEEIFTYDWTEEVNKTGPKQIFNSSYDNATVRVNVRQSIAQLRDIPFYAGSFRWTGHDYLGEAGFVHGGWPFKAFMGGIIDLANFEKDHYYLYQSQWTKEPMIHILPHWTHPVMELGTQIPVWVYTNCDEAELFFNGKSLGKQKPGKNWDEMQCQWMVAWEPGELKAVAYQAGKPILEEIIRTADAPAKIALSIDGEPLADRGKDIVQVRVTTQDKHGTFYPYGENRSYFHVIGPGAIDALDNGSPIDVENHHEAADRIAFFGLTRAYIKSTEDDGDITLLTSSILGEKKQVTSNLVHIDTQLLALRGELARPNIKVFYTLDGTEPNKDSTPYQGAFKVSLGTTVKAVIMLNDEPVQHMQERFATDAGFVWDAGELDTSEIGEQAENAWISRAEVSTKGKNFHGKGFVDLGDEKGSYVEWYQENDGAAGDYDLQIRYSGIKSGDGKCKLQLTINEDHFSQIVVLPNSTDLSKNWQTVRLTIPLVRGANYIRLTAIGEGHVLLDEIALN